MKLRNMYGEYIANFGPVLNVSVPADIISVRERDQRSIQLENSVTSNMLSALSKHTAPSKKLPEPANKIRVVNYEDAIKELIACTLKPANDKS